MAQFSKYQGTGNDFIIIDNRDLSFQVSTEHIASLCERRFGIGADGLILLQNEKDYDFRMVYFNADGNESSMCGNGGRCIVAFAKALGIIDKKTNFIAVDGPHEAHIELDLINLQMSNVDLISEDENDFVLDTGSPHYVHFVEDIVSFDVFKNGKSIRNSAKYKEEGINVNFVEFDDGRLVVRTYERGVEDETYSCGTGVTAASICFSMQNNFIEQIPVSTLGGQLQVCLKWNGQGMEDIWLQGPAKLVFEGTL